MHARSFNSLENFTQNSKIAYFLLKKKIYTYVNLDLIVSVYIS